MKHAITVYAVAFSVSACALWLTSCASNEVKGPQPPVTVLKSEPVSTTDTNEVAPAVLTAQQEANKYSDKPLTASRPADPAVQAVAAVIAVPVISKPAPAVDTTQTSSIMDDNGWTLFFLLLALILLMTLIYRHQIRNRKNKVTTAKEDDELASAKKTGLTDEGIFVQGAGIIPVVLAKKAHWVPVMDLTQNGEKEIAVKAFYKGKEYKMHFSAATTVKKVTAWAAYQCGIFDQTDTEVFLAIQGYSAPLTGTAHIGRFVMQDKHHLELDVLTFAKNAPLAAETALINNPELAEDEILVEGAGMAQAVKVSVKPNAPAKEVIGSVARAGSFPPHDAFLFLENESTPLNPNLLLDAKHPRHVIHHVHTQMEIAVTVFHNGKEHKMHFSPATTVKKVTAWAAYQFEIFDLNTAEVYLAIHGYSAPLASAAHIGRFVEHDKKNLALDVLTFTKVTV